MVVDRVVLESEVPVGIPGGEFGDSEILPAMFGVTTETVGLVVDVDNNFVSVTSSRVGIVETALGEPDVADSAC